MDCRGADPAFADAAEPQADVAKARVTKPMARRPPHRTAREVKPSPASNVVTSVASVTSLKRRMALSPMMYETPERRPGFQEGGRPPPSAFCGTSGAPRGVKGTDGRPSRGEQVVEAALVCPVFDAMRDQHGTVVDRPDLDTLIRDHHLRLVRLAYVCCGDAAAAEDIVADAYARAWPRLSAGRVDEPLAYLRRAVLNTATSWRRHRSVVRREAERRRPNPGPDSAADLIGERDELIEAIRRLPASQIQVIALRYLEDLSEAETARQLRPACWHGQVAHGTGPRCAAPPAGGPRR